MNPIYTQIERLYVYVISIDAYGDYPGVGMESPGWNILQVEVEEAIYIQI